MPELPEVEVTKQAILPFLKGKVIFDAKVFAKSLRWPIDKNFSTRIAGQSIKDINRRSKYLIISLAHDHLLIHLGMSGRLYIREHASVRQKHEHVIFNLNDGQQLVYYDPRKFGIVHLFDPAYPLPCFEHLGPEPLTSTFNTAYFHQQLKKTSRPIKTVIMDNKIVVGVGNIYASESLFLAKISPLHPANQLSKEQCKTLLNAIKKILKLAIKVGGTTLKDFHANNQKGYFQLKLAVYNQENKPCVTCKNAIVKTKQSGRSSFHCPTCQPYVYP